MAEGLRAKEQWQNQEWIDPDTGEIHSTSGLLIQTSGALWVENMSTEIQIKRPKHRLEDEAEAEEIAENEPRKRGKVKTFSRKSQRRLMLALSSWEVRGKLTFLTLTYPRKWPDPVTVKKDFERFIRLCMKHWPEVCGQWKLEYQMRGAPHFHANLAGISDAAELVIFQQWIDKAWKRARKSQVPARTQAAFANHTDAAKYYLTKEAAKSQQTKGAWGDALDKVEHEGRFWGWFNKKKLRTNHIEYRIPSIVLGCIQAEIQKKVLEKLLDDEWAKELPNGKIVRARTGEEIANWRLQSWMLFKDPVATLKEIWTGIDWDWFMVRFGWDRVPELEDFALHNEPPPFE